MANLRAGAALCLRSTAIDAGTYTKKNKLTCQYLQNVDKLWPFPQGIPKHGKC